MNFPTEDKYQDLNLTQEFITTEAINESEGVSNCALLSLLDSTKADVETRTVKDYEIKAMKEKNSKPELYMLDEWKEENGVVTFEAEDDNRNMYKVLFDVSDFEAFLEVEHIEDFETDEGWQGHAQAIYDAWRCRQTYYNVTVTK